VTIQVDSLRSSVENLANLAAVTTDQIRMALFTDIEKDGLRAGVIKNFDITYELSWKLMKRWLEEAGLVPLPIPTTRKALFRLAAEQHLIADAEDWLEHHKLRISTTHEYSEAIANFVTSTVNGFIDDAKYLVEKLELATD